MAVPRQMTAILFLMATWLSICTGCDVDMAVYKVTVKYLWSEETFPKEYPLHRPKAQWSPVFGQSHNASYTLYHVGDVAKPSIRNFAQYGRLDDLVEEGEEDPKVYDQFSASAVGAGTGETGNMVFVDGGHSLVSMIARIIPSPDWFIGLDSLDLCIDDSWVDQVTLDLQPLDAGAASGLTFTAPRWETVPPAPVSKHGPREPNHPAGGFYYPTIRELPAIAKVELNKVKEYSTKEINDLARSELLAALKRKDKHKGIPRRRVNIVDNDDLQHDFTTKNYVEQLKDLEEEPVDTPKPNNPENNVVVVTRSPVMIKGSNYLTVQANLICSWCILLVNGQGNGGLEWMAGIMADGRIALMRVAGLCSTRRNPDGTLAWTTTVKEFDSGLENMDDVVLAVAHGRRMGLGKHLPRHFRSRLHHAVNRIQPNDCLVSDWSEWSACSVTCGFGEKFRIRRVVRQKQKNGRDCPALTDRKHCGNVNSCSNIDYFDW